MGMSIDEAIIRYKNNAEYERTHGNLQGCLEFRQLAKWLEKLQKIQEILRWNDAPSPYYKPDGQLFREICEVIEDGSD
jgi:hypothetical protein